MRWRRNNRRGPRARELSVKLKLPMIGEFGGVWVPRRAEAEAAWELYVELVTRISAVELKAGEGLAREALTSLYSIFGTTREILRKYGPELSGRDAEGDVTFGTLALTVLDTTLRPLLSYWHPRLLSWEEARAADIDRVTHENAWEHIDELRARIEANRQTLRALVELLAEVAGVAPLTALPAAHPDGPAVEKRRGGGDLMRPIVVLDVIGTAGRPGVSHARSGAAQR